MERERRVGEGRDDAGEGGLSPEEDPARVVRGEAPDQRAGTTLRQSENAMSEDLTDAKIAAAEARTDAKLAGFQGQFDVLSLKLDTITSSLAQQRLELAQQRTDLAASAAVQRAEARTSTQWIIGTVLSTGLVAVGLLYAMLSFGAASWYNGTVVREQVTAAVQEAVKQNPQKAP